MKKEVSQIPQYHLAAKLLALVMVDQLPQVQLVGGGVNSIGFYYDFILKQPLTEPLVEWIEVELQRMIKEDLSVHYLSMMRENATLLFEHHHHPLLALSAAAEKSNIIELVKIEDFYDLCPTFSINSTSEIGVVKILEIRKLKKFIQGKEEEITRFIGACRPNSKELKRFLKNYDDYLKNKDHRILGPKLNLFSLSEEGVGVRWHQKGLKLLNLLQDWLYRQIAQETQLISTPTMIQKGFLERATLEPFCFEKGLYCLRDSPLKQHLHFLQQFPLSVEELPWRLVEFAQIYRPYPEAEWWGLYCACAELIDHHTICLKEKQVQQELISSLHFIEQIITIFGFEAQWVLVVAQPKKSQLEFTKKGMEWLRQALGASSQSFPLSRVEKREEGLGEAACCLELRVRDAIGREWPVSTLEVMHPYSELKFSFRDNERKESLVVLKRQIYGSIERFIALLIEHYGGTFPLWLASEQVRVFAIGEANQPYAKQVVQSLQQKGLRVGVDMSQAKLSTRVHQAEKEQVPYLIFLGEEEKNKKKLSIRIAGQYDQRKQFLDLETFLDNIYQESLFPSLSDRKDENDR